MEITGLKDDDLLEKLEEALQKPPFAEVDEIIVEVKRRMSRTDKAIEMLEELSGKVDANSAFTIDRIIEVLESEPPAQQG